MSEVSATSASSVRTPDGNLKSSQRASRRVEADADLARGADFGVERGKAHN
ncbi:MAG: hypothetical protein WBE42_24315 [Pseudolabrys sp.]